MDKASFSGAILAITGIIAGLLIEGEELERTLAPGDYVEIPPHVRHRVEWTLADRPTVWLEPENFRPDAQAPHRAPTRYK